MLRISAYLFIFSLFITLSSCTGNESTDQSASAVSENVQDSTDVTMSIVGLDGPEAVRYDPDKDVYFISNFTGG
ncbi:MAG: hypothetical protein ACNS60_20735, partial [Candidatus Cyclobacteriaceae bacterium M2_1C_046]